MLDLVVSTGKEVKNRANELISKYATIEPITTRLRQKTTQRIQFKEEVKAIKNKAIAKIQNLFRNTSKFKVSEEQAFKSKVMHIVLEPTRTGSTTAADIEAYIARSFIIAKKRIPKESHFKIYAICELDLQNGESLHAKSETFDSKELNKFFKDFNNKISDRIQSGDKVKIKKNSILCCYNTFR